MEGLSPGAGAGADALDTQLAWPVVVAIFPSKVMAYFQMEKGWRFATRWSSASFAARHRAASSVLSSGTST